MDILNKYLEKLQFKRVEDKGGYAIYGAGIAGMFGAGKQRYILLFVPSHLAIPQRARASELPWKNLQTRNLQYSYNLKKQSWNPPKELPNPQFQVVERGNKYSSYVGPPDIPFEVLLLHDLKKKTKYQYHNHLSLYGVLESFSSVFNYIGEPRTTPIYHTPALPPLVNNLPQSFTPYSNGQGSGGEVVNDQFDLL
uniref:Uncharacterized protein n=1 Tax=Marseillevirus LCMAC101 TaxID=2506602 RepID=A0A481YQM4_9VIRU|nr:MAG: uncharacterized protein LCMAC101_01300 [Marseillevirus LCMAC101]